MAAVDAETYLAGFYLMISLLLSISFVPIKREIRRINMFERGSVRLRLSGPSGSASFDGMRKMEKALKHMEKFEYSTQSVGQVAQELSTSLANGLSKEEAAPKD